MKSKQFLAPIFVAFVATFGVAAHADGWGCEVLLCLSNPAGPMAVSECVPPITRLYKAIFKTKPDPFPTCVMSNGMDSKSAGTYGAVGVPNYYDACPAGTTALPAGLNGVQGVRQAPSSPHFKLTSAVATGIGGGEGVSPRFGDGGRRLALEAKTCVGNKLRDTTIHRGRDDYSLITSGVYDRVVYVDPAASPFVINVYVNNALFRAVRPKF